MVRSYISDNLAIRHSRYVRGLVRAELKFTNLCLVCYKVNDTRDTNKNPFKMADVFNLTFLNVNMVPYKSSAQISCCYLNFCGHSGAFIQKTDRLHVDD